MARTKTKRLTVRERLQARIEALGWQIEGAHKLRSAVGYYRINRASDDTTTCWDTWIYKPGQEKFPRHLVSYDTMTACARGCVITADEPGRFSSMWWCTAIKPEGVK